MKLGTARLINQRVLADGYREMRLAPVDSPPPRPGQFLTILPPGSSCSFLRRPFAYSHWSAGEAGFIYEVRGRATQDLASLPQGSPLNWMGPLGSAFPLPPPLSRPVLISGGIGIGPLYYWAAFLAQKNLSPLLIIGARRAGLVPELPALEGVETRVSTDDGSAGIQGNALEALNDEDCRKAAFYTCGPYPLLLKVHELARQRDRPCWVSVEEMMACGTGACQGCAVPLAGGGQYLRACKEGPVFPSRELLWT